MVCGLGDRLQGKPMSAFMALGKMDSNGTELSDLKKLVTNEKDPLGANFVGVDDVGSVKLKGLVMVAMTMVMAGGLGG